MKQQKDFTFAVGRVYVLIRAVMRENLYNHLDMYKATCNQNKIC